MQPDYGSLALGTTKVVVPWPAEPVNGKSEWANVRVHTMAKILQNGTQLSKYCSAATQQCIETVYWKIGRD